MTYGDVASELSSRAPRAVGRVMATEGSSVPWWRVVRADGRPPAGHEREALERYRAEGTPLRHLQAARGISEPHDDADELGYRLDLGAARWIPWRDTPLSTRAPARTARGHEIGVAPPAEPTPSHHEAL